LGGKKTQLLYQLYDAREHTVKELCEMMGISKTTLYAYLKERKK
jgi:predicted DNA binding protein